MLSENETSLSVRVAYGHPYQRRPASDEFVQVMDVVVQYVLLPLLGMDDCIVSNDPTRLYPMDRPRVGHPEYISFELDLVGPHDEQRRNQLEAQIVRTLQELFAQIPSYDWISFRVTISKFQDPISKVRLGVGVVASTRSADYSVAEAIRRIRELPVPNDPNMLD